jgi:hypothetical protein
VTPVVIISVDATPLAASSDSVAIAAMAPVILLTLAFLGYCFYDLSRSKVKYLPKWAWVLVCLASVPLGGIIYLMVGREHR